MREVDALCDSWMGSNDTVESYCGYLLLNSTILHTIHIRYILIRFALCPVLLFYLDLVPRSSYYPTRTVTTVTDCIKDRGWRHRGWISSVRRLPKDDDGYSFPRKAARVEMTDRAERLCLGIYLQ